MLVMWGHGREGRMEGRKLLRRSVDLKGKYWWGGEGSGE